MVHAFSQRSQEYFQRHKNWILFPKKQEDELIDEQEFLLCEQPKEFLYK